MAIFQMVLFDVNGTLLGYEDPLGFEKRFAQACADLGFSVTVDQVSHAFDRLKEKWAGMKARGLRRASSLEQYQETMTWVYQAMLEELGIEGDLRSMAGGLYERFVLREGFMPLYSDVQATLSELRRQNYRLGILSNFPPHLETTLKLHGIHHHFHFFVVSSLVGLEKPDPAIFELAIQQADCPKEEILYVGDSLDDDVRGAQAVGLSVILIDRHDRRPQTECITIRSLAEIPPLLDLGIRQTP